MSKKCYRFFGGLLTVQKNWLNKMAEKGYRLIRTGKLLYEFEKCKPGQVQYCVEFIGQKSKANAEDYHDFLEEMGYSVFYKNINLNYSVGKVRWRPWAEIGGRIATNTTTFNREILRSANYYSNLRNPWLLLMLMLVAFATVNRSVILGIVAVIFLIPVIIYQLQIMKNRHEAKMKEW